MMEKNNRVHNHNRNHSRSYNYNHTDTHIQPESYRQYIAEFYKGNKLVYFLMVLSAALISTLNLFVAWLMQQMADAVSGVSGALEINTLAILTVLVIALVIPLKALKYISEPKFMQKAMTQFKNFAFQKLMQKNIASFHNETTSVYLSAFSNDLATIETNYLEMQCELAFSLIWASGALVLMLLYSPILTLAAVFFLIMPMIASMLTGKYLAAAQKEVSAKNAEFVATFKDALSGFSVIKGFGAENAALGLLTQSSIAVENSKCKKRKVSIVISTISNIAGLMSQLGTFLTGAVLALSGRAITPGVLIAFISLTGALISSIRTVPELFADKKAAAELIYKIVSSLESNVSDERADIPNRLNQGIFINHLSFGYEQGHEILHDIDMSFEAGKSYAIVGSSGSGKSTLLNLLMSAYHDYSGTICFDDYELRDINSSSLYGLESMIEQNVFVFDASIRDNITMFREFKAEDINNAITLSGLSELIARHGEDYMCGENGRGLSGGEKQRISIARSLLQKSSVLLADEVTAALDAQTAYQVVNDILKLKDITRIIVTHTLTESLLQKYDTIVVLKDGRIIEKGTFDELMVRKGYFYALYTVAQ
ncbi:MAG: ABC transporter ATP-binding protein/permease [Clostridiales bacterium]|nr:ABC transporter ATP-binding protein/permease [Clostridiales bacterium]